MKPLPFSLLAPLLVLAPVLAQDRSILPYLPKDTVVAFAVPNLSASIDDFSKMPLAKMWREEEVQTFLADLKEMVTKHIDDAIAQGKEMHAQGALPFDPEVVKQLRIEAGTFAVTGLALSMGDFGPDPKIGMVLHLDFGASAPTWTKLIQTGLSMMEAEARDELVKKESKVGDVQVISYTPNEAAAGEMGLHIAMVPDGVLIGSLASDVSSIVESMTSKTAKLAATELYQTATKSIATPGAELDFFFHPAPLIDFLVSGLRIAAESGELQGIDVAGVDRAVTALGLRDLGAMAASAGYVDGKCVARSYWANGKAASTAAVKTLDTSFLKWVPKDAVGFSASTMDVSGIWERLVKGVEAYDPEFAKMALGHLAEMEKQLGFNIRDDFFGSLGDHMISWSMPMGTISAAPEMAFLLAVKDEAKIVNVLKSLTKLSNGAVELEEGEKRGLKVYQLRVNLDPMHGMGNFNFLDALQPTFAFKGGYLVGGFSPGDIKRVFQRMDREDDPKGDIRSNKEFAAVASSIPTGVDSLSFTDWKQQFESFYQIATGLMAFVPLGDDVPIDTQQLPDSATLTKHLYASVSWSKSDAKGTESVLISPFGPEVGLLVGGAIVAGIAVVGMRRGF